MNNILNGTEELAKAIEKLNVDLAGLVALIAETSIWASPLICERLRRETGDVVWFPNVRKGHPDEKTGDVINDERIDDNTYADCAIRYATGITRNDIRDFRVCHIWDETCHDTRYHTAIPNLVLIPSAIAGLSDCSKQVKEVLKYRSYELYEWYPDESEQPPKPGNYPTNWQEPQFFQIKISKYKLNAQEKKTAKELKTSLRLDAEKEKVQNEIDKIFRKVPKWFQSDQINSRILIAFMQLLKDNDHVSREKLEEKCSSVNAFFMNFGQMTHFGKQNHGKVFEVIRDEVRLWKPVAQFIIDEWNKYPELH